MKKTNFLKRRNDQAFTHVRRFGRSQVNVSKRVKLIKCVHCNQHAN